jgi:LPXTG-motif cell wall-anchored protein
MRTPHLFGAAVIAALLAAAIPVGAQTAPEGIGTSSGSSSVLTAELGADGALLALRALGDDGQSSIDPDVGTPEAFAALHPLSLSSGVVPALDVELPAVEVRSTGAEKKLATEPVKLDTIATSGALNPATLSAVVDDLGARSGLSVQLVDLRLVAGLVSVDEISATLGTNASKAASEGARGVTLDNLTVLDLGALLEGLGIPLEELSLDKLIGLLGSLGLPLGNLPAADIQGAVNSLNTAIDTAQALVTQVTNQGLGTVCQAGGAVGGLNQVVSSLPALPSLPSAPGALSAAQVPSVSQIVCDATTTVQGLIAQLNNTIDDLQDRLAGLLAGLLDALAGAPLLAVEGVDAGITTKAVDTVEGSVATAEAAIGAITVGSADLGGIDVLATVDQVNALLSQVTTALNGVLGAIDPGLNNLVSVSVLDRNTEVSEVDGYVQALASLTAVTAEITPPADLAAIVNRLLSGTSVSELITRVGATVPALEGPMSQLGAALGAAGAAAGTSQAAQVPNLLGALASGPSTVQVASLSQVSNFAPTGSQNPAAPVAPTGGTLPRTGDESLPALLVAGLLVAAAFGIRRLARR